LTSTFYKDKGRPDGFRSQCKQCEKQKALKWNQENKEAHAEHQRTFAQNNSDLIRAARAQYVARYPDRVIAAEVKYLSSHPEARLRGNLRRRLNNFLKRTKQLKIASAVEELGCSIEELKKHLESKFQLGMSWDNYGEWEIDHIKPLVSFDMFDVEQVKQACHYSNLQPLWKEDNRSKGGR
jgi:hypothetical protein